MFQWIIRISFYSTSERVIVEKVGGLSGIDRIDPGARSSVPPANIFGEEPEHGWCYYYQQASLARQTGDWTKIGDLYQEAISMGLYPADLSEYFVFIEGLVNLGQEKEAIEIIDHAIRGNEALEYSLCSSLASAPDYPEEYGYRRDRIHEMVCD